MIEQTLDENLSEPDLPGFYDFKVYMRLKKNVRPSEERNLNDNLPEWSDSEEQFPNDEIVSKFGEAKAQDMAKDDALYWEKEIGDVMENLKRFQTTLAEGKSATIEDVFNLQPAEDYKTEKLANENDLKASIAEIEKMDALLKINYMEEKKAKLSRLQAEEKSRTILTTLTNVTMTKKIKMNSEEFLKLLHDPDQPATGVGEIMEKEKEDEEENKAGLKERIKNDLGEEKNLKNGSQPKLNFVERNIELAKCGGGILALTKEEKLRIETLLMDIAEPKSDDSKNQKIESTTKPELYALDDKSKSTLSNIDQRLEAFSKEKPPPASQSNSSSLEHLKLEEEIICGKRKSSPNRLIAVNKLLNRISSATDEEINPLSPEDLNRLIEEGVQSMGENESKPPPEVIADLVSNAKVLMPKFKYRFREIN